MRICTCIYIYIDVYTDYLCWDSEAKAPGTPPPPPPPFLPPSHPHSRHHDHHPRRRRPHPHPGRRRPPPPPPHHYDQGHDGDQDHEFLCANFILHRLGKETVVLALHYPSLRALWHEGEQHLLCAPGPELFHASPEQGQLVERPASGGSNHISVCN